MSAGTIDTNELPVWPIVHFVGFRGDEYSAAVRIWGKPHFIHFRWDRRARRDIHPIDTVIFATGTEHDPVSQWNGPDIREEGFDEQLAAQGAA